MSKQILVGSMNGLIHLYSRYAKLILPVDVLGDRGVMGLAADDEHLFIASRTLIKRTRRCPTTMFCDPPLVKDMTKDGPEFHQILLRNGRIYLTCTAINEVWVLDLNLDILAKHIIKPPRHEQPVHLKSNYNHINSICYHDGRFYVGLNWFRSQQYGRSGICILDHQFNELTRFEYGWEMHGFTFIDNKKYALCATSGTNKPIHHPRRAGLMVDGSLVFEHSTDIFCKAFVVDENHIYIVGGDVAARKDRGVVGGIMYILDRRFNLLDTIKFEEVGQLCGIALI